MKTKLILPILIALLIVGGIVVSEERKIPPHTSTDMSATSTQSLASPSSPSMQATSQTNTSQKVPVSVSQNDTISITEADQGKTITVQKNTRVVLALGGDVWSVSTKPEGILSLVPNMPAILGVQGIYVASKTGQTTIFAEGKPNCTGKEMCAQYLKNFSATIIVK